MEDLGVLLIKGVWCAVGMLSIIAVLLIWFVAHDHLHWGWCCLMTVSPLMMMQQTGAALFKIEAQNKTVK